MILNANTGKKSWWFINSIGCSNSIFSNETTWATQTYEIPNEYQTIQNIENFIVNNCLIAFYWIEIVHSSVLIFFSVSLK
jgi:hypothetical protein